MRLSYLQFLLPSLQLKLREGSMREKVVLPALTTQKLMRMVFEHTGDIPQHQRHGYNQQPNECA